MEVVLLPMKEEVKKWNTTMTLQGVLSRRMSDIAPGVLKKISSLSGLNFYRSASNLKRIARSKKSI